MAKVKLTHTYYETPGEPAKTHGDVVEVSDELAQSWINDGGAVAVPDPRTQEEKSAEKAKKFPPPAAKKESAAKE